MGTNFFAVSVDSPSLESPNDICQNRRIAAERGRETAEQASAARRRELEKIGGAGHRAEELVKFAAAELVLRRLEQDRGSRLGLVLVDAELLCQPVKQFLHE